MSLTAWINPSNGFGLVGMIKLPIVAGLLLMFASSPAPMNLQPPAEPVPATYFGMHIHHMVFPSGTEPLTPWPSVQVPEWRLWDAKVTWPDLEPAKGEWRFDIMDKSLALAEAHHAGVLFTLGLTPRWASARPQEPSGYAPGYAAEPRDIEDWRVFVRTVATRYKGRIHAYEIWNEPNIRRFWTGDVDQLVAMTREAHNIIKSIDPSALIVSPPSAGLRGTPWLAEFLQKGGGQYVDVIGYHFYVTPRLPEEMAPLALAVRKVMADNGIGGKPIWNTEFGWLPPARFESEEVGAAYLVRGYLLLWAAGVQRSYWYAWDNHTSVALKTSAIDNQPLAAGKAYEILQRWLTGARVDWCNSDATGTWRCQLSRGKKLQWIVWTAGQNAPLAGQVTPPTIPGTKPLPAPLTGQILPFTVPKTWPVKTVTPLFGQPHSLSGSTLDAGPVPTLLSE